MLADGQLGRQTKGKWKNALGLLLAAVLILISAWLLEHPGLAAARAAELRTQSQTAEAWLPLPDGTTAAAMAGDVLICAGGGSVSAVDLSGEVLWRQEAELHAPVIHTCGTYAAVYDPGGKTLILAGKRQGVCIPVSQGVDLAAPGSDGQAAVVSSGSGYLTETRRYGPDGTLEASEGMTDRATVLAAFLGDGTLAACCCMTDGRWLLCLEDREIPLEADTVYDMRRCGGGLALWTCDGVSFYRADGTETGSVQAVDVLDWACGDYAALAVRQNGQSCLLTVHPDGTAAYSEPLERVPAAMAICGDFVCLLDRTALLVYDDGGILCMRSGLGARAGRVAAAPGGVLLLGDGQMLRHMIS